MKDLKEAAFNIWAISGDDKVKGYALKFIEKALLKVREDTIRECSKVARDDYEMGWRNILALLDKPKGE